MNYHIETDRLILRDLRASDVDDMFKLDSDAEVHKYLGNKPFKNISQSEDYITDVIKQYDENGIGRWALIDKRKEEFMGWSGLKLYNGRTMNGHTNFYDIGYRIMKRFWGQGFATESSLAVLDYGFNKLNIDTIYGITEINNETSHRVLLKSGLNYIEDFYFVEENLKLRWYKISKL